MRRVVDVSRFRSRSVQFNDFEISPCTQFTVAAISNVVSADEKSGKFLTNFVKDFAEFLGQKICSVQEDTALAMISRFNEPHALPRLKNFARALRKSLQIRPRDQPRPGIRFDQISQRSNAVSHNRRKFLPSDTEDVTVSFARKTIVKDSRFLRAVDISLQYERSRNVGEVLTRFVKRLNFPETSAPLTGIGF